MERRLFWGITKTILSKTFLYIRLSPFEINEFNINVVLPEPGFPHIIWKNDLLGNGALIWSAN